MPSLARAARPLAWILSLGLSLTAAPALAATFVFDHLFEVASLGSSGSGTPRGLSSAGGDLLVSDALDDQIFRVDPSDGALLATYETDPFACAPLNLACVPSQEWGRVIWDIAWDGTSLWAVDKETTDGSVTWLIELNSAGQFLQRLDVSAAGALPGGLAYDPRGDGALLLTDRGSDWAAHLDLAGNLLGVSSLNPDGAGAETATGITHFEGDLFLVLDATTRSLFELEIPEGGGAATLIGQSIFQGFDVSTLAQLESADYDAASQTLTLVDAGTDRVYVFTLVPEPGTGLLLALGLAGLAGSGVHPLPVRRHGLSGSGAPAGCLRMRRDRNSDARFRHS